MANRARGAVVAAFEAPVPGLAHHLMVPKGWLFSQTQGRQRAQPFEATELSVTTRDSAPNSPSITVAVRDVPFEVPVDALTTRALTEDGWTIERARWVSAGGASYFDVTAVKALGGLEWVRRTTARAAAGRVFEVNALGKRGDWDAVKEIFWAAGAQFEVQKDAGQTRMEGWRRYEGQAPAFALAYPESWQPEVVPAPATDTAAVNLRLMDPLGKVLLGYLQIQAQVPVTDDSHAFEGQLDRALEKIRRQDILPIETPRRLSEAEDPRALAVPGWLGTFVADVQTPDGGSAQLRLGFLDQPDAQFQIIGISPTLEDDPIAALRGQRAFEIARQTLQGAPSGG